MTGARWQLLVVLLGAASCSPPTTSALVCRSDRDCSAGFSCSADARCVAGSDGGALGRDEDAGPSESDGGSDGGPLAPDSGRDAPDDLDDGGDVDGGAVVDGGDEDDRDPDAGRTDAGPIDAGPIDAGPLDGGELDAGPPDDGPFLLAVHPGLAAVGDVIVLEGRFPAGSCTVSFGGQPSAAEILVPTAVSRLSVSVPSGAKSGGVSVTCGAESTTTLPLRVTSFQPRLGAFSSELEQTTAARALSKTLDVPGDTFAFSGGSYLYVLDSRNADGNAERASVYADGTLGPFEAVSAFFPARVDGRAFVRVGDWLYALGGDAANNTAHVATVDRAPILPGGVLGPFTDAGVALVKARASHQAVVVGRWLYVLGGRASEDTSLLLNTLERAPIYGDGSLGAFAALDDTLWVARDGASLDVIGDWLYVVGGTGNLATAERAAIDDDGALGPFLPVTAANLAERRSHGSLVLGDQLCVVGGDVGSDRITSVQCALVDGTSSLNFVARPDLRMPRGSHGLVVLGNRVLALGGRTDAAGELVHEWAPLDDGAAAGSEVASDGSLPTLRDPACAVVGDRVLVSGGLIETGPLTGPSDIVYAATIDADGDLGAFTQAGALSTARSRHRLAVLGDEVWALGGMGSTSLLDSTERASLSSPLASTSFNFTGGGPTLFAPLASFYAFLADGVLYTVGGRAEVSEAGDGGPASDAPTAVVTCLDVSLGGGFADCGALVGARFGPVGAVLGASVYVIGGGDKVGAISSIEESDLSSLAFSTSGLFLNEARQSPLSLLLGGRFHVIGGVDGENRSSSSESVAIGSDGEPSGNFAIDDALPLGLSAGCVLVLKNRVHVLSATPATVSGPTSYSATLVTQP